MKNEQIAKDNKTNYEFSIQRIYVKDLSFEAPNIPEIFQMEWEPQTDLNLDMNSRKVSNDTYETLLHIMVTVKLQDKLAFLVEVKQAGVFTLRSFTEEQLDHTLNSYCPGVLFPYARELISETIIRGSFPPLYMAPINFDAIYQEKKLQRDKNNI
jgi:preprotein translocase subunit SecB